MPTRATSKTTKRTVAKKASNPKDTGVNIISFSDGESLRRIRELSCGKAKSGKTHFAGSWPKPFIIDTDKGLLTVADKKIPYVQIQRGERAWQRMLEIINDLEDRDGPVWDALEKAKYVPETLVIDSLSALSDLMEVEIVAFPPNHKDRNDELQIQDYNTIQRRLFGLLDRMRELPFNLVCTVGIDYAEDDVGHLLENPSVTGKKLGPRIPHFFDEVYLHSYDKSNKEWLLTPVQTTRFPHAGSRKGIPMEPISNPTYDKMKKYYK